MLIIFTSSFQEELNQEEKITPEAQIEVNEGKEVSRFLEEKAEKQIDIKEEIIFENSMNKDEEIEENNKQIKSDSIQEEKFEQETYKHFEIDIKEELKIESEKNYQNESKTEEKFEEEILQKNEEEIFDQQEIDCCLKNKTNTIDEEVLNNKDVALNNKDEIVNDEENYYAIKLIIIIQLIALLGIPFLCGFLNFIKEKIIDNNDVFSSKLRDLLKMILNMLEGIFDIVLYPYIWLFNTIRKINFVDEEEKINVLKQVKENLTISPNKIRIRLENLNVWQNFEKLLEELYEKYPGIKVSYNYYNYHDYVLCYLKFEKIEDQNKYLTEIKQYRDKFNLEEFEKKYGEVLDKSNFPFTIEEKQKNE